MRNLIDMILMCLSLTTIGIGYLQALQGEYIPLLMLGSLGFIQLLCVYAFGDN